MGETSKLPNLPKTSRQPRKKIKRVVQGADLQVSKTMSRMMLIIQRVMRKRRKSTEKRTKWGKGRRILERKGWKQSHKNEAFNRKI